MTRADPNPASLACQAVQTVGPAILNEFAHTGTVTTRACGLSDNGTIWARENTALTEPQRWTSADHREVILELPDSLQNWTDAIGQLFTEFGVRIVIVIGEAWVALEPVEYMAPSLNPTRAEDLFLAATTTGIPGQPDDSAVAVFRINRYPYGKPVLTARTAAARMLQPGGALDTDPPRAGGGANAYLALAQSLLRPE